MVSCLLKISDSEMNEIIDMMTDLTMRYSWVKRIYIEAEESDPEMATNLQPFNEFKSEDRQLPPE